MRSSTLSAERLKELLHYDPDTGVFTRRVSRGPARAGSVAGADTRDGYRKIHLDYKFYLMHRLAWLYTHGEFPTEFIDHIDGDRANNRIQIYGKPLEPRTIRISRKLNQTTASGY